MKKKSIRNNGFSLVELSLVLIISSVVVGHLIEFSTAKTQVYKLQSTRDKISFIEKAIYEFLLENGRIPCPSTILGTFSQFSGLEARDNAGQCLGDTPNLYISNDSDKFNIGTIPTKSLKIPDEYAIDAWGRRLTYVVVKFCAQSESNVRTRFFKSDDKCGNNIGNQLQILDQSGQNISNNAIFVILSHGKNGHGAIRALRNFRINAFSGSMSEGEIQNSQMNEEGEMVSNRGVFSQRSINLNKSAGYFDDILSYKTRNQVIKNAQAIIKNGSYLSYLCKIAEKVENQQQADSICGNESDANCGNYLNLMSREIEKICY